MRVAQVQPPFGIVNAQLSPQPGPKFLPARQVEVPAWPAVEHFAGLDIDQVVAFDAGSRRPLIVCPHPPRIAAAIAKPQ